MNRLLCMLAAFLAMTAVSAQDTKIEFFTPTIVHVVKGKATKTLVVTATPNDVKLERNGNTISSSELVVRQDSRGALTFLTAKGKVLLREAG